MDGHIHMEDHPWARCCVLHNQPASHGERRKQNPSERETAERAVPQKSGQAKVRPSHISRAGLRDDLLQHTIRNTRNMQIRCSKGKHLSVSQRSKFEHWFSDAVSSILGAENLRTEGQVKEPASSPSTRVQKRFPISRSFSRVLWYKVGDEVQ